MSHRPTFVPTVETIQTPSHRLPLFPRKRLRPCNATRLPHGVIPRNRPEGPLNAILALWPLLDAAAGSRRSAAAPSRPERAGAAGEYELSFRKDSGSLRPASLHLSPTTYRRAPAACGSERNGGPAWSDTPETPLNPLNTKRASCFGENGGRPDTRTAPAQNGDPGGPAPGRTRRASRPANVVRAPQPPSRAKLTAWPGSG